MTRCWRSGVISSLTSQTFGKIPNACAEIPLPQNSCRAYLFASRYSVMHTTWDLVPGTHWVCGISDGSCFDIAPSLTVDQANGNVDRNRFCFLTGYFTSTSNRSYTDTFSSIVLAGVPLGCDPSTFTPIYPNNDHAQASSL